MTKTEMVMEMVMLGIISKKDVSHIMKWSKAHIESTYRSAKPARLAYLASLAKQKTETARLERALPVNRKHS